MYDTSNAITIRRDIEEEMRSSFLAYSMSVITSRALPDVRDGLKPVHRRILYTLFEKSLTPEKPYRKCADIVGTVLGEYHPHGDSSVYMALVRLAQSFSMRYPLVDGHGNFGSIDGDPPAAYRYTEAKMTKMSVNMLTDIQKETVNFQSNYDDRLKEPTVLPARFPNLLVNGSEGIAVGMASHIPPHNLGEVIDALDYLIDTPDATLEQLMAFIKGPDFPTGGIIMGRAGIRAAYATGRGKLTVRSKTEITEIKNRQCIIVTEIPYMVNKAELIKSIAELSKEKRVEGIHDIRDESDRQGLRICIELKKDANANLVLNQLFRYTQLQDTYGVINLALVNGIPKELSLKQILEYYLEHQIEVVQRSCRFDLRKARERAHILQGFVVALDFIDEVVEILRSSKTIPEGKARLIERFQEVDLTTLLEDPAYRAAMGMALDPSEKEYTTIGLSDAQADAIVQMRLGQLTGLERDKILNEVLSLCEKINDLRDILAHKERVLGIIREDLEEIRGKFGDERRTAIENISGEKGNLKTDFDMIVTPKDIDVLTKNASQLIATAINLSLQKTLTYEDLNGEIGRIKTILEDIVLLGVVDVYLNKDLYYINTDAIEYLGEDILKLALINDKGTGYLKAILEFVNNTASLGLDLSLIDFEDIDWEGDIDKGVAALTSIVELVHNNKLYSFDDITNFIN